MGMTIVEPNTCIRGCCRSESIPLHLPPSAYSISSPIARGAESVVYAGTLDGKKVAVKKPILSTSEDIDKFHKELQMLCKLEHRGLATLIAAHAKPPNYMYFFQLYESGNLADKLHVEEWTPTVPQVLTMAIHLGRTIQYLHNNGILHRDVKPANILLDKLLHPYLTDFGLAEYKTGIKEVSVDNWKSIGKPTGGFHKKNMVGTLIYMAPEVLKKQVHTEKSDVYSFGITINELLTGVVPYTNLRAEAQAHTVLEMNYTEQQLTGAVASEGLRPLLAELNSNVPATLLSLIERCWDPKPQTRPSFDVIVSELDQIINGLEEEGEFYESSSLADCNSTNSLVYEESVNWLSLGEEIFQRSQLEEDGNWVNHPVSESPLAYRPVLSWGSFATCGRRETMEDTHFLMPQVDVQVFGIFDGHRGAAAAEFSVRAIPKFISTFCQKKRPSDALVEAFIQTDSEFRNELEVRRRSKGVQKDWHPGCTAIVALIVGNKLFVANAGDCRAILSRSGCPYPLSKDHLASCDEERNRVILAGEDVKWQVDTWRVGLAALQVTRSIGDDDLKPAVTAEPEVTETTISENDEYLVMASDGLWDVMSGEDIVSIIKDTVKEPGMCSKRLATEAAERGSKDNITVIVVFLRPVSTAERIY
ncbi:protein kinase and PP2C-like domain-containing protein [Impatiens glandulifera]|uniref:protein kinase and PP2C-like domain-containing protein n=1 Tax=Impatiens glandulifera TaxID=253017 RepID=UPI001FB08D60|nr:protein kinase and PP2C-like domain-containing protein [Impatiens glandulifera]